MKRVLDMLKRFVEFVTKREWSVFIGALATLLLSLQDILEQLRVVSENNHDWSFTALVPLIASAIIRSKVWSEHSVTSGSN